MGVAESSLDFVGSEGGRTKETLKEHVFERVERLIGDVFDQTPHDR
jgi:hypothetical protein